MKECRHGTTVVQFRVRMCPLCAAELVALKRETMIGRLMLRMDNLIQCHDEKGTKIRPAHLISLMRMLAGKR